mgnify:CR=1 FL=1
MAGRPTGAWADTTGQTGGAEYPAHTMDPLLVYPDPPPPELAQCLDLDGWAWKSVADPGAAMSEEPDEGWAGAIVVADTDPEGAFALCRRLRKVEMPLTPLLLLVGRVQLADGELRDDLFDDFCLRQVRPAEPPANDSSTHLTLPTVRLVLTLVLAVPCTKN